MEPVWDRPLRFNPLLKQILWGGRKLGDQLGKKIGPSADYAESWEIVDHDADQSLIVDTPFGVGTPLGTICQQYPEQLYGKSGPSGSFPLLLKYLDCNRVLSVQVHPNDAHAAKMAVPDRGKTEAWFVVDREPGAKIYAGLKSGVDRQALSDAIAAGTTEDVLHAFEPEPGDVVFIPAGTVHALGAGLLIAEIQQSSDTTFRLFDWNRVDAEGRSRDLHVEQALEVIDFGLGPVSPRRTNPDGRGWQSLVTCDYFELSALRKGDEAVAAVERCEILTVPKGSAELQLEDGTMYPLATGETVLISAAMPKAKVVLAPETILLRAVPLSA